jgi:hypothetical protein
MGDVHDLGISADGHTPRLTIALVLIVSFMAGEVVVGLTSLVLAPDDGIATGKVGNGRRQLLRVDRARDRLTWTAVHHDGPKASR